MRLREAILPVSKSRFRTKTQKQRGDSSLPIQGNRKFRCIRSYVQQIALRCPALRTLGHLHAQLPRPVSLRLESSGSPRNNEAWAAPAASFAYCRGLANGLRRGFGTQCCHLRARVCECDSGCGCGRGRRARRSTAARGPAPAPAPPARRGRVARPSPETIQPRPGAVAMSVAGLKKQFHKASQVGRHRRGWGARDLRSPLRLQGLWGSGSQRGLLRLDFFPPKRAWRWSEGPACSLLCAPWRLLLPGPWPQLYPRATVILRGSAEQRTEVAGRRVSSARERVGVPRPGGSLDASLGPALGGGQQRVPARPPSSPPPFGWEPPGHDLQPLAVARASVDPGMLCTWRSTGPSALPARASK